MSNEMNSKVYEGKIPPNFDKVVASEKHPTFVATRALVPQENLSVVNQQVRQASEKDLGAGPGF